VVSQAGLLGPGVIQALVAGLIGLVAGLASGWQAGSQRARAFAEDWARTRQDQAAGAIVDLIQTIATKLARAAHAMWWLTWRAAHDSERVTEEALNGYEWELHQLIPEIVGAHAALAAMNADAAAELDPAVARLHLLCGSISEAAVSARASDRAALGSRLADALAFKAELNEAVKGAAGKVLASYGAARKGRSS
jgi:hypothetical protein